MDNYDKDEKGLEIRGRNRHSVIINGHEARVAFKAWTNHNPRFVIERRGVFTSISSRSLQDPHASWIFQTCLRGFQAFAFFLISSVAREYGSGSDQRHKTSHVGGFVSLVRPAGIEPATVSLKGCCSTS